MYTCVCSVYIPVSSTPTTISYKLCALQAELMIINLQYTSMKIVSFLQKKLCIKMMKLLQCGHIHMHTHTHTNIIAQPILHFLQIPELTN